MDRAELIFRNGCQRWHAYLARCAKDGKLDEASGLLRKIGQYLEGWKKTLAAARAETRAAEAKAAECRRKEASIQLRMRMLAQLLAGMDSRLAAKERPKPATEGQPGGDNE